MDLLTNDQLTALTYDHLSLRNQPRTTRKEVATLDDIIGTPARRLIATARRATYYRLDPIADFDLTQGQVRNHRIVQAGGDLSDIQLRSFRSLVLQSKHHIPAGMHYMACNPSVAVRVHGATSHAVLIDPDCDTWYIRINGGSPDSSFVTIRTEMYQFLATFASDEDA